MAKKTIEKPLSATPAADPHARGANGDASSMLLSIKSVAAALDVSVRTIRNLNSQGDIPNTDESLLPVAAEISQLPDLPTRGSTKKSNSRAVASA